MQLKHLVVAAAGVVADASELYIPDQVAARAKSGSNNLLGIVFQDMSVMLAPLLLKKKQVDNIIVNLFIKINILL
jgi:hypothetical protein